LSRVYLAACSVAEGVLPMGATNFTHFQPGQNADAAFAEAVSQALYDNAHGGYTGTIAEKSGFQLRNGGRPMTPAEAQAFFRKDDSAEIVGYLFYGLASE
jgi:hypothetical protein